MVLLGAAVQAGHVPVARATIVQAIRLNNIAVDQNLAAFEWGRLAVAEPALVAGLIAETVAAPESTEATLEERIDFLAAELTRYQDERLALRYRAIVDNVVCAERRACPAETRLAWAAVENTYKILAVKDEYEVARLMSDSGFRADLGQRFGRNVRPTFHFAPSFLSRKMTRDGRRAKRAFGPWMIVPLRLLASLRFLRATPFDPFHWQAERRAEREFAATYLAGLMLIAEHLSARNHAAAVEFACLPKDVSGFGYVKQPRLEAAMRAAQNLMPQLSNSRP
jgi:indolepyruvate ferredoxin oxidoreductase